MFDIDLSNLKSNNQKQYILNQTKDLRPKVNYNAFYSAIVVNTNDFYHLGRIQIRIPSIHGVKKEQANYIEDSDLPWAKSGILSATGNDMGQYLIPEKGSRVFVTFEANDSSNPIYFGGIPTLIGKPKEYNDNPDIYNGDIIEITDNDKIKDIKDNKAMQIVYKSFKGATIEVNDKDGQESIKIIDASGQVFEMGVLDSEGTPLPRRGDKEMSDNPYRFIRLGNEAEYIEIIDGKIHIAAKDVEIDGYTPGGGGGGAEEVQISDEEPTEDSIELWVDMEDNSLPLPVDVVIDPDYVHTDNNFTDEDNLKLLGIESGAQVNKIESISRNGAILPIQGKRVDIEVPTKTSDLVNDSNYVIDENYVHTDNNFTTGLLNKLNGIEDDAQVNKIESISVNNVDIEIIDKKVNIEVPTKTSELINDSNYVIDEDYVHTDNNFTTTLLDKLNRIEDDAQVNKIEVVKVNNKTVEIQDKTVNIEVPTKTSELTNDSNYVADENYVHTDNNFTNEDKQSITSNTSEITTLKSEVSDINGNINSLSNNKLDKNFTEKIVTDLSINKQDNSNNVSIVENKINPSTKEVSTETNPLPLASSSSAGLMTKESYSQLAKNTSDIESLKETGGKYIGVGFDTYAELEAYTIPDSVNINDFTFVRKDETHDGATSRYIVVLKDGKKAFDFAYIINEASYGNFQKGVAGLIVGNDEDGTIFAELDGTGSVVGWDTLKSDVNNAKSKLSGIESGAQVNKIEVIKVNNSILPINSKSVNIEVPTKTSDLVNDSNYVIDSSYVHTDNNFTTTLLNKLNGIASGAQVNKIEVVQKNGVAIPISNKTVDIEVPTKTSELTNDSGFIKSSSSITGNAATATKLQTARTINGTSFDGSANITTANWGTARSISIVSSDGTGAGTATSINGSTNYTLKLPSTIKATLSGNATSSNYLKSNSTYDNGPGTMSYYGKEMTAGTDIGVFVGPTDGWYHDIHLELPANNYSADIVIPVNDVGGLQWRQNRNGTNYGWYKILDSNNYTGYTVKKDGTGATGTWGINISGNAASATRLQAPRAITLSGDVSGTADFDGTTGITINTQISGSAPSADKLTTARTINGTSFDGTKNITTANWGTARNIGIVNSDGTGTAVPVSVNGSGNINLKLPSTIKATLSGNASSATQAKVTDTSPTTSTWYRIVFTTASGTGNTDLRINNNDIAVAIQEGTTSAVGFNILALGNGIASGTAGNKYGKLRLYSQNTGYDDIQGSSHTGTITHTLPNASGTLLNSANYTSYTVTKTGTGASGTWGIGISGNAATATKLQTARKINGVAFDGTKDITIPVSSGTVGYIDTSLTASLPEGL